MIIHELEPLEDYKEGWGFHGIDKHGRFITLKKAHYFKNGVSLCGKYKQPPKYSLISGGLFKNEVCKECFKRLERR